MFHYRFVILAALIGAAVQAAPAAAHPHVLVDAKAEIVFDGGGRIVSVRHIWQFDEAFTAFAVQGLDADNDGKLSQDELAPLAKVNVDSLQEFDFFTDLTVGKTREVVVPPTEYWLEFHGGRLTLFYTLPLKTPAAAAGKTSLEIFDPEYFVAFTFDERDPIRLDGAPTGCTAAYRPPHELDAQTMATLAAIPQTERDLPPALQAAAAGLANLIAVDCPPHPVEVAAQTAPLLPQRSATDTVRAEPSEVAAARSTLTEADAALSAPEAAPAEERMAAAPSPADDAAKAVDSGTAARATPEGSRFGLLLMIALAVAVVAAAGGLVVILRRPRTG